jgi:anthranilate/para-aminobenzoate synthase component I
MTANHFCLHGRSAALLQQQLDRQPFTPQPHPDLPFLGGALGLFGYDLGRRFERCPLAQPRISRCRIWRWGFMTGR